MEYDFNQNDGFNDQSQESEGDSVTIDNNDYEDYSEEFQIEENPNENKQEENANLKEKSPVPNPKEINLNKFRKAKNPGKCLLKTTKMISKMKMNH